MNSDLLILQAQFKALRNLFQGILPSIYKDSDQVWLNKYLLWQFERDFLLSDCRKKLSSPEKKTLEHRCFQLSVLMDVAYIRGSLEEFGLNRYISSPSLELAQKVIQGAEDYEEEMCRLIDEL